MKKILVNTSLLIIFSILTIASIAQADKSGEWSQKKAKKWFKKQEWLYNMKLKPHESINQQELARQYQLNKKYWDEAFSFLKGHDLRTLPVGKYIVDTNNVTVAVTDEPSRDFEKTNWESHRKFIDIQCLIKGREKMGVSPVADATVTNPYNEAKDVANYTATGKYYVAEGGTYFIFFPSDAHRPNISPGEKAPIKKVVVKVRAAE